MTDRELEVIHLAIGTTIALIGVVLLIELTHWCINKWGKFIKKIKTPGS